MIFLLLLLLEISSAFDQRPQNTVVKIGQSFELSCSSVSPPIDWFRTSFLANSYAKIKKGYNLTLYTYGDISGQKLKVSSARDEHAGIYTCSVMRNEATSEASAIVVVIVDDPVCEMKSKASLMENDRVELRCSFSFLGPARPFMRWRQLTDVGWKEFNCTQSNSMSQVTCQLNCLADLTMHQSRFQCQTSFHNISSMKPRTEIADNALNYSYLWTSDAIRILYGPRNLVIHPPDGVLYPNEQVNCSAEGFPPPSIEWINLRTSETIPGPSLPLDKTLVGDGARVFMCRAVNMETKQTANISIEFRVPGLDESKNSVNFIIVSIAVISGVVIVALTIVIAILLLKRGAAIRRQTDSKATEAFRVVLSDIPTDSDDNYEHIEEVVDINASPSSPAEYTSLRALQSAAEGEDSAVGSHLYAQLQSASSLSQAETHQDAAGYDNFARIINAQNPLITNRPI